MLKARHLKSQNLHRLTVNVNKPWQQEGNCLSCASLQKVKQEGYWKHQCYQHMQQNPCVGLTLSLLYTTMLSMIGHVTVKRYPKVNVTDLPLTYVHANAAVVWRQLKKAWSRYGQGKYRLKCKTLPNVRHKRCFSLLLVKNIFKLLSIRWHRT